MSGTIGKLNVFKSRPPAYTPPTGEITMGRNQFMNMFRTRPDYPKYVAAVGAVLAGVALDNIFDEALRYVSGVWSFLNPRGNATATSLRFANQDSLASFFNTMGTLIDGDIEKIDKRRTYIADLKRQALSGSLYAELLKDTEPESDFYAAATLRIPQNPLARPLPQVPVELAKGQAWLIKGVTGSTRDFKNTLARLRRTNQSFPLGPNDQILRRAWQKLVPNAPAYRGWNIAATQQLYPSSIGGAKLLDELLADTARRRMPPRGHTLWYDLALYIYGAIMTAQPFTDGNKRMSRLAYVLMLASGDVPFKAPTAVLGSRLGPMQ